MKRPFSNLLATLTALFAFLGCSESPFPDEQPEYAIAFVIDRSGSYHDNLTAIAFRHFVRAKETLFRDAAGSECLVIVSKINGDGTSAVLFEGSLESFSQRFPTKDAFSDFILQSPSGSSPVFSSCAETIERLCRRHASVTTLQSLLLVYSDMEDTAGGREQFEAAVREYGKYRSAIGIYGASESWGDQLQQWGVQHAVAYDEKRFDPPLPELP